VEVVAVKENVAVAVVAQEEKRLEGAPEGELFLVNVLASAEFQPSASLEDELRELDELLAVLDDAKQTSGGSSNGDDGDVSWGKQYAAVDSVRRVAIHHSDEAQLRLCVQYLLAYPWMMGSDCVCAFTAALQISRLGAACAPVRVEPAVSHVAQRLAVLARPCVRASGRRGYPFRSVSPRMEWLLPTVCLM
jgi:hypothetical protein